MACWLHCKYNWFNRNGIWSGSYTCVNPECSMKLKATMDVMLKKICVIFEGMSNHIQTEKPYRLSGELRKQQQLQLLAKGVRRVLEENINTNYLSMNHPSRLIYFKFYSF